jgi:hypothetical protein
MQLGENGLEPATAIAAKTGRQAKLTICLCWFQMKGIMASTRV